MTIIQLSFDFDATSPADDWKAAWAADCRRREIARWKKDAELAAEYWQVGMVTSLSLMSEIEGLGQRYTSSLPGIVELIQGDFASVRIYAAPDWGYTLENYPLHLKLAINVPLVCLSKVHWHHRLQQIVDEGKLAAGCQDIAAELRAAGTTKWCQV